jgi:Fic family protein
MDAQPVTASRIGIYLTTSVAGENVRAYMPPPLPPDPPLILSAELQDLIEKANRGLGRLDGIARVFPEPELFLYQYVRKEALLSSQIEGTQSSLTDLLLFEASEMPGVPIDDVEEVSNYVAAMNHALMRMHGGFPLSLRLLRETHAKLLAGGRGAAQTPGEFRRSQNWIGGTRPGDALFVPPPPEHVMACMGALEKFLHDEPVKTPAILPTRLRYARAATRRSRYLGWP